MVSSIFFDTLDPVEVCRDGKVNPLELGELATVQPDYAFTSNAQEANAVDYAFWARHMDFINFQGRVQFNFETTFFEDLVLDGVV
jgi:hypothetical protein